MVGFVPGVTPRKWFTAWRERVPDIALTGLQIEEHDQLPALLDQRVRMCLVRLPFDSADHHLIPLYEELPVVVVPADHVVTAVDEVVVSEIADELVETPATMPWSDRIAVVAGGAGLVVAPMSVAREFHRKDLAWRVVTDLPTTRIGLAWARSDEAPEIEDFIGVVRGRTVRSSRGAGTGKQKPSRPATTRADAVRRSSTPRARRGGRPGRRPRR